MILYLSAEHYYYTPTAFTSLTLVNSNSNGIKNVLNNNILQPPITHPNIPHASTADSLNNLLHPVTPTHTNTRAGAVTNTNSALTHAVHAKLAKSGKVHHQSTSTTTTTNNANNKRKLLESKINNDNGNNNNNKDDSKSTLSLIWMYEGWGDYSFLIMLLIASTMGSILNYSIFLCTAYNSPLTTAVVGTLKNVFCTYLGMIAFHDYAFTIVNFTGINISIVGSLYYTYITIIKKHLTTTVVTNKPAMSHNNNNNTTTGTSSATSSDTSIVNREISHSTSSNKDISNNNSKDIEKGRDR